MGPRKLAAADRVGSAWNDVRGPEGDFSVYESGSIRVAVARLPTFQRVVHTRRPYADFEAGQSTLFHSR